MQRSSRLATIATIALALASTFALAACDDDSFAYAHVDQVTGDPNTSFSMAKVSIPAGEAVVAHIQPFDHGDDPLSGDLVSDDPTILEIRRTVDDATYAFLGVHEGSTVIHVIADGAEVRIIPAVVTAQPSQ
jgi:hypothetical protein